MNPFSRPNIISNLKELSILLGSLDLSLKSDGHVPFLGWPLGYLSIFPHWFHKDPKYLTFVKGLQGPTKFRFRV